MQQMRVLVKGYVFLQGESQLIESTYEVFEDLLEKSSCSVFDVIKRQIEHDLNISGEMDPRYLITYFEME